jgi:hypothetical protein
LIPTSYLQEWSAQASWPDLQQVEQDLIICPSLCDLFNASALTGKITFRGGTAINKLLFKQPLRYSEDIDLVRGAAIISLPLRRLPVRFMLRSQGPK